MSPARRLAPEALYPFGAQRPPRRIIDVRAPVEVARGALPYAHALPLLSDAERHQVGLRYAEAGQDAAIALGWELTTPALPGRVDAWRRVADDGPTAVVCWRGGLRSALATELIDRPATLAVEGGYKAVRRHLLDTLPQALERAELVVLSGLTGAGKTELLSALAEREPSLAVVDLEALARHRGSSFGGLEQPQPAQASFEHDVAVAIRLHRAAVVLVEDESRYVGRVTLPDALLGAMQRAPVALLETPLAARVDRIVEEYVLRSATQRGVDATRSALDAAVLRLRRRLGNRRVAEVRASLAEAEAAWFEPEAHRGWVGLLLESYYDRLYERNRARLARPEVLRGDAASLADALLARARSTASRRPSSYEESS